MVGATFNMETLSDKIFARIISMDNMGYAEEDVKQFIKDLKELDIDLTEFDKEQIDKLAGPGLI